MARDWSEWHRQYETDAGLARRLGTVQSSIADFVCGRGSKPISILSICSGDGRDIAGALSQPRCRAAQVSGRLVELDPDLGAAARRALAEAGLDGLEVLTADAGETSAFVGAVPADLIVACGVFGNIPDPAVERTVRAMPMLCARGAAVVWTRHRRPPDLTPAIRTWFVQAGFVEQSFHAIPDSLASVGCHVFGGRPVPLQAGMRLFDLA